MKTFGFALFATATAIAYTVNAQSHFSASGFSSNGAFHLTVSGAAEIDASHDLQNWTKYATVNQDTGLEDMASRQLDRRFYRAHSGTGGSNIVGFVKVVVPAGKMVVVGNSFGTALRLDTPEGRHAIFGITNPPVKVSLYTNGNFGAHTLDPATGTWAPPLRPIRPQEGFAVQNLGTTPITVHLSGEVRQGHLNVAVPAGTSLLSPYVPYSGPMAHLLNIPAKEGTQVQWFDEQTQQYQTATFDTLGGTGQWQPKLPDLRVGRAFILKTPQALTWTNGFPTQAH